MDNYDLFAAIGTAADTYLMELEQPSRRRMPRRFGLIAALIALLLTACAAPVVLRQFNKVQTAARSDTGRGCEVYVMVGGSRQWKYEGFRSYDAEVQVTPEPDAPDTLETVWFPMALLDQCDIAQCDITDISLCANLSMEVPRYGLIYGVLYQQHVLPKDGNVTVPGILGYSYLEQDTRTYGDVEALIFYGDISYEGVLDPQDRTMDTNGGLIYSQIIFWSDGYYLYCLRLPLTYNLPVSKIESIVNSLTPVEDMSLLLPEGNS